MRADVQSGAVAKYRQITIERRIILTYYYSHRTMYRALQEAATSYEKA